MTKTRKLQIAHKLKYWQYNTDIKQSYKKPSKDKIKAFEACEWLAEQAHSIRQGIIAQNGQFFTYAFLYYLGQYLHCVILTRRSCYDFIVNENDI